MATQSNIFKEKELKEFVLFKHSHLDEWGHDRTIHLAKETTNLQNTLGRYTWLFQHKIRVDIINDSNNSIQKMLCVCLYSIIYFVSFSKFLYFFN